MSLVGQSASSGVSGPLAIVENTRTSIRIMRAGVHLVISQAPGCVLERPIHPFIIHNTPLFSKNSFGVPESIGHELDGAPYRIVVPFVGDGVY